MEEKIIIQSKKLDRPAIKALIVAACVWAAFLVLALIICSAIYGIDYVFDYFFDGISFFVSFCFFILIFPILMGLITFFVCYAIIASVVTVTDKRVIFNGAFKTELSLSLDKICSVKKGLFRTLVVRTPAGRISVCIIIKEYKQIYDELVKLL